VPRRPVDGEKVYGYFGGQPDNWPRDVTFQNVLRKLSAAEVSSAVPARETFMRDRKRNRRRFRLMAQRQTLAVQQDPESGAPGMR